MADRSGPAEVGGSVAPCPPGESTEPVPAGLGLVHEHGRSVRVTLDGRELTRYVYLPWDAQLESPRPYLHPVRTLHGDLVSLYRPHDHVWHKGIAWSLPNVGTQNFWGGRTYCRGVGYQQLDNNGSMDHERFDRLTHTEDTVTIGERLRWHTPGGEQWFAERRSLRIAVDREESYWSLVFATEMTNTSERPVPIGSPTTQGRDNAGYGGLFWRGPRSFSGGRVYLPGARGADDLMGTRAPWLAFTGQHDGHGRWSTLAFVEDPGNPGSPNRWFVRSEVFAGVCPAPFFDTELRVEPGRSISFRYAVVVADGQADASVAEHLADAGGRAIVTRDETADEPMPELMHP